MRFLDILMHYKLDLSQISFHPGENVFCNTTACLLATSIAFYHIVTRACAEIKILSFWTRKGPMSLGFSIFGLFFRLPFFSFSFLFAPVIDLLLGLLPVKILLRKRDRDGQFLTWISQV